MVTFNLQAPDIVYPVDGSVQQVSRFIWYPMLAPTLPAGVSSRLNGRKIAIIGGSDEMVHQMKAALEGNGATAYHFSLVEAVDEPAAEAFTKRTGGLDGIIDLNLAAAFTLDQNDIWEKALQQTVVLLKAVYQDWLEETDSQRLFYIVVTHMGGKMGYADPSPLQPLGGIWAGLAKTLHRELPNCNVKIVDYASQNATEMADLLVKELYRWELFEIGYVNDIRYTLAARKEVVPLPTYELGPSDLVLISGGGRGIGFALAKALAQNFGCRVVVTGRSSLPTADEPWLIMTEQEFKSYRQLRFRVLTPGKSILEVRHELEQLHQARELFCNIQDARNRGLRISYEVCDFTSQQQTQALVSRLGPALSGVIHNAGIDAPTRLPAKSVSAFIHTIQIKVYGFLHLVQALKGTALTFFCNVGSLTGRWGGMVGQLDYAAANEGLTRLGLWAEHTLSPTYPIKTLCWPTWNRLGMIANFEATLKYMTAMDVEEGLYHWQRELLAPGSGEITFIGPIGKALSPAQARGYLPMHEVPGFKDIYPRIFYLGEVQRYQPSLYLQASNSFQVNLIPCFSDFQIDATDALPISLLLEVIVYTSTWITALEQPAESLQMIRNVTVNLPALKASEQSYQIEQRATGRWSGDTWIVTVEVVKQLQTDQECVARAELVYGHEPYRTEPAPDVALDEVQELLLRPLMNCTWKGNLFKLVRWCSRADRVITGRVASCYSNDLWSIPFPPHMYLPQAAMENIFRAALAEYSNRSIPQQMKLGSIKLFGQSVKGEYIIGCINMRKWYIIDKMLNQVTYLLERIEFL